ATSSHPDLARSHLDNLYGRSATMKAREYRTFRWPRRRTLVTRGAASNHRDQPIEIFSPQSACLLSPASGDVRCRWTLRQRQRGKESGGVLVQLGLRAIPFGIAAMILGFVLKSAGTQARPADTALPGPRLSVFGTIHPEIFRLSAPLGSEAAGDGVRLASLEPQVGLFDAPAKAAPILTDTSAAACQNPPFEERFAALDDHPAPFDRFASADDCASFDERFGLAMRVLPSSPRLPPDQEVQNRPADAPPKTIVSNVHVRLAQPCNEVPQPRKEVPPLEDDGRTAIYDITARTVYLPSGRRLEAHSGFGDLMDNPRHVHVRMQGATPPNVYNLTLRERLFHG